METKKRVGRKAPPAPLDPVKIGQMIARLRSYSYYKYKPKYDRYRYARSYYIKTGSMFSDEEIMAALHLTKEQFDLCVKAWEKNPPRKWTTGTARDAFYSFVRENKRWPREKDYRNWRETGLPDRRSLEVWCEGEWTLIERYANSHKLTPEMVLTIPNITTRRNVIARFGIERLIREGGGEKIQQDDYGSLWRLPSDGDDKHMLYVEVVNKTPKMNEKTGKYMKNKSGDFVYDHYFLRVPPNTTTAKDAVAWTFSMNPTEFVGFAAES